MRRIALGIGMLAVALVGGCKSTQVDPLKYASIEVDPRGAPPVAPPGPGDISRKFAADRAVVAKCFFRNLSSGIGDGDFAIDQDRGRWFFQKEGTVEGKVRSLRGRGPGGHWVLVEIRPEAAGGCTAIVRGKPKVDEAVALVLFDKVEEELKGQPAPALKTKS
jgi:hypothetical protein